MSGLSIGLAFGLAAAGGVSGVLLSVYSSFLNMWTRDPRLNISTAKAGIVGAFMGAALGLGGGFLFEKGAQAIDNNHQSTLVNNCLDRAAKGEKVIVGKNTAGAVACIANPAP